MGITKEQAQTAIRSIESEFLPYQIAWIYDPSKFRFADKSVRVGWTFAHSWWSLKKRLFRNPMQPPINELFASKNLRTAAEYMQYLRRWGMGLAELFPGFMDTAAWTSEVARLPGGNIEIISSDPDGFRGKGADVTLDEFDYHDQQAALFAAAQSRADWLPDGQISIFSSRSNKPGTTFKMLSADIASGRNKVFSYHRCTLYDAVEAGLHRKQPGPHHKMMDGTDEGERRCKTAFYEWHRAKSGGEATFRREYLCEDSDLETLVSPEAYDGSILRDKDGTPVPLMQALDKDVDYGELYVGIDVGRSHDPTVVWVVQRHPTAEPAHYRTLLVRPMRNKPFDEQFRVIRDICDHPCIVKGLIDRGAIGQGLAESVANELGGLIQPVQITRKLQDISYGRLRGAIDSRRFSLVDNITVRGDFLSMRMVCDERGVHRYEGGTRDTHGDFYCAAALALHAAEGTTGMLRVAEDVEALVA